MTETQEVAPSDTPEAEVAEAPVETAVEEAAAEAVAEEAERQSLQKPKTAPAADDRRRGIRGHRIRRSHRTKMHLMTTLKTATTDNGDSDASEG